MFQSEICDLNCVSDSSKSEISDKNQFEPVHEYQLVITCQKFVTGKKAWSQENYNFLPFLAKLTFNIIWLKISAYRPLKLCSKVWN